MYLRMGLSTRWVFNFSGEMNSGIQNRIFTISSLKEFHETALEIFHYQAENNSVYKDFIFNLGIKTESVRSPEEIPFLPIEFFRNHKVVTGAFSDGVVFESSGTTGTTKARHHVTDLSIYEESFLTGFRYFYGDPADYFFAGLLPSYVERGNSSLVYMVEKLINTSSDRRSGFFMDETSKLITTLQTVRNENRKCILIGVSFALLDLAEKQSPDLSEIIVVETGGMKGRRKEITREELHATLKKGLNIRSVHSEYGMTELLSQAWSKGDGLFYSPPWMKIILRDTGDPLSITGRYGTTGGINVIDLANINSCSFIATSDLGKIYKDGRFEVLGRFDSSDIRGCNLLVG
jgi:phenylacetate-coenzyme A ligase PaaK-like adenylate-forming protein